MNRQQVERGSLGAKITRASSKQTYYTIRFFADRHLREDAYRAYGYFRWVDDVLDAVEGTTEEKNAFVQRQRALLEAAYRGEALDGLCREETLLAELVQHDDLTHPGLYAYLDNLMTVMEFDVERRGRLISQAELDAYSHRLAVAVTEALFYFIGHDNPAPTQHTRYHAVTAAHITHMLRDFREDAETGYYNIPGEYLQLHEISPQETTHMAAKAWVRKRVQLAQSCFESGREYIGQVRSFRCRVAGFAYAARFEWVIRAIERDNFCLQEDYPQRKSFKAALKMFGATCASLLRSAGAPRHAVPMTPQTIRTEK